MINTHHLLWIVPLAMIVGAATLALFIGAGDTPRNCRECEYASTCKSWYGGTGCKHKEEINHGNDH